MSDIKVDIELIIQEPQAPAILQVSGQQGPQGAIDTSNVIALIVALGGGAL